MSWKRLESATIDPQISEGLEARVADPLWFLARQWQTGEFKGNDAANPFLVRMRAESFNIDRLILDDGRSLDLSDHNLPLEPLVESESVMQGPSPARVSAEMGRLLVRSMRRVAGSEDLIEALQQYFPLQLPADDNLDPLGRRRLELVSLRSLDGIRVSQLLRNNPSAIVNYIKQHIRDDSLRNQVKKVIQAWFNSVQTLFSEDLVQPTWNSQRMEYQFGLAGTDSSGTEIVLNTADGYSGGRLDWYSFNCGKSKYTVEPNDKVRIHRAEVLPNPLRFRGMPLPRFWEFEDAAVYFGGIESAPEDLARIAVANYGTVYGDDWMVVPLQLPFGTLTQVTELVVLDDFGKRSRINSSAVVDGGGADRAFKFFEMSGDPNPKANKAPLLFLPPTVETTEAARPLEDIRFIRDEISNVAWAIEHRIESVSGRAVDIAARVQTKAMSSVNESTDEDSWSLVLATAVPKNWVPLIPVRLVDTNGQSDESIMLQRGRVPVGADGTTRGAKGFILTPNERLLIHEEEIPSYGVRVVRRYQSARDVKGRLHTWVGRRKGPGRGEGKSGLVFDDLEYS